jgi:hypothetical protein
MAYVVLSGIGFLSTVGLLWAARSFNTDYQRAFEIDRSMGLLKNS